MRAIVFTLCLCAWFFAAPTGAQEAISLSDRWTVQETDSPVAFSLAPDDLDAKQIDLSWTASTPYWDFSVSHGRTIGFNEDGQVQSGRSAEVRIGQNLGIRRADDLTPSWYFFLASDDESLLYQPSSFSLNNRTTWALQDSAEIGDMQVGLAYANGPWQTSFVYVERETSTQIGAESFNSDESFVGITITRR
jgi:hypothetical protein